MRLKSNIVNPEKYFRNKKNNFKFYRRKSNGFYYDFFNFAHTDFGRLILISIDKHPEIKTVELVIQNDNKGAFFIIYYHNGKVESYINTHLSINKKYLKPNRDWTIAGEHDFEYSFEDTKNGIKCFINIVLKNGMRIKIKLRENSICIKRYSFLAAIGANLREVKRFPFIYLKNAGFIPVEGTEISFEINSKKINLTKVPLKVEGKKCFKTVYSLNPLPFFWNEERNICLSPDKLTDTQIYQKGNIGFSLIDNNGHKETEKIIYKANEHSANYRFSPPFPDIFSLKNGYEIKGKFFLGIDNIDGVIEGKYFVIKTNDEISIIFHPEKCWQPMPGKDWVSKYQYYAKIKIIEDYRFKIKSKWVINSGKNNSIHS